MSALSKCDMLGCRLPATGLALKFGRGPEMPLCERHGGPPPLDADAAGLEPALAALRDFVSAVHQDDVAAIAGLGQAAAAAALRLARRRGLAVAGPDRGYWRATGEFAGEKNTSGAR